MFKEGSSFHSPANHSFYFSTIPSRLLSFKLKLNPVDSKTYNYIQPG